MAFVSLLLLLGAALLFRALDKSRASRPHTDGGLRTAWARAARLYPGSPFMSGVRFELRPSRRGGAGGAAAPVLVLTPGSAGLHLAGGAETPLFIPWEALQAKVHLGTGGTPCELRLRSDPDFTLHLPSRVCCGLENMAGINWPGEHVR